MRHSGCVVLLALLFGLAPAAEPVKGLPTVEGTIKEVNARKRSIVFLRFANGNQKVHDALILPRDCELKLDNRKADLTDLRAGQVVVAMLDPKTEIPIRVLVTSEEALKDAKRLKDNERMRLEDGKRTIADQKAERDLDRKIGPKKDKHPDEIEIATPQKNVVLVMSDQTTHEGDLIRLNRREVYFKKPNQVDPLRYKANEIFSVTIGRRVILFDASLNIFIDRDRAFQKEEDRNRLDGSRSP